MNIQNPPPFCLPERFPPLLDHTILIWQFPIPEALQEISDLLPLLSRDEQEAAVRHVFPIDRIRALFSKALLRYLLSHYVNHDPKELIFKKNKFGKPYLWIDDKPSPLQFNISHTSDQIAIAFSRTTELGIDIEKIREVPEYKTITEKYMSALEYKDLLGFPTEKQLAAFFHYWTMKEAFLKGLGIGIGEGFPFLKKISCVDDHLNVSLSEKELPSITAQEKWTITQLDIELVTHKASLAYKGAHHFIINANSQPLS